MNSNTPKIIGYKCKHCNQGEGKHAMIHKWCPSPDVPTNEFVGISSTKYERDVDKPIYK